MNRQWTLATSALIALIGIGIEPAIASQHPTVQAQKPSVCRQYGSEYQDLYSIEVDSQQTITVCQKGKQYYYVRTMKSPISSVPPAPNDSKSPR